MGATEYQYQYQSSFLGRISIRINQVMGMEGNHDDDQAQEHLELFQKNVADRFSGLLSSHNEPMLSIAWLRKLLDVFLCCETQFKALLITGTGCDPSHISKPPLDRHIPELLDRLVKSLDICNAACVGVEALKNIHRLANIAVSALEHRPLGDGEVRRAKKALNSLITTMMLEDKDRSNNSKGTERTRPFGSFRSLSWKMARNYSAAKQIHAMSSNLVLPRSWESSRLALPVYMMSAILVFVMWTLVGAIPCEGRNVLGTQSPLPRQWGWAQPMIGLQEKIEEEWKKKEKKGSVGLLEEMQRMEKLGHSLIEFADTFRFPVEARCLVEVKAQVEELADICRKMEEGLEPLQQQIREVFHRVVRSRTEFLLVLDQAAKLSVPTV